MAVGGGAGGAGRGRPAATGAVGRRGGGKGNHRSAHESLAARGGARRILHHSRRDGRRLAAQERRPHRGAQRDLPAPRLRHRRRRQGRIRLPVPRQPLRRRRQLHQRPQTALYGAYRKPREATWWLGLVLLGLLLAFCLTGSLLPWDERGYWATRVTLGIAGTAPMVGPALNTMLSGGQQFGNLTLTRFYAVHAMLLPLLLLVFAAAHVAAMRKHGITPRLPEPAREEPFWPRQGLYDAAFSLLLLAALFAVAAVKGAPLQGPADPGGAANPRPEWY